MKKIVLLFIISAFTVMLAVSASANRVFYDVKSETEGGRAVYAMAEQGILCGYGNGFFGPEDTLTRAQAVKILNKMFYYTATGEAGFSDVSNDAWYAEDVKVAVKAGYINGYGDGRFGPDDILTKEHVCVMLDKIMNFVNLPTDDVISDAVSPWAKDSVYKMLGNRLASVEENGFFHATEPISRQEACLMLSQFIIAELPVIEEFDINKIAKEELSGRLSRVIAGIRESLMTKCDKESINTIFSNISENMEKYLSDFSFDYKKEADNTQNAYYALAEEDRKLTKQLIMEFFTDPKYADDLSVLYEFFF